MRKVYCDLTEEDLKFATRPITPEEIDQQRNNYVCVIPKRIQSQIKEEFENEKESEEKS